MICFMSTQNCYQNIFFLGIILLVKDEWKELYQRAMKNTIKMKKKNRKDNSYAYKKKHM